MAAKVNPIYRTYEDFDYEDLLLYAGADCFVTSRLLRELFPRIAAQPEYVFSKAGRLSRGRAPSILSSTNSIGMKAFEFIIDMELNGILYDVEKNQRISAQLEEEIAVLEDSIFRQIPKLDLNSGQSVGNYLYRVLKLPVLNYTKTGEPSTDGDTMKALAKQTGLPWLVELGKRGDLASIYRTFIANYVDDHVKLDGRIHPSYNLTGTSSFRITGEHPNLTQLPRPKWGYNVRDCFIVDPGEIFITFDYSSCEVKVLGAICKDPKLLQAIKEGKDFHSVSASALMGMDYDEFVAIRKDENHPRHLEINNRRQAAKALTFS